VNNFHHAHNVIFIITRLVVTVRLSTLHSDYPLCKSINSYISCCNWCNLWPLSLLLLWGTCFMDLAHYNCLHLTKAYLCASYMFQISEIQLCSAVVKHMNEFMGQNSTCWCQPCAIVLTNNHLKTFKVTVINTLGCYVFPCLVLH